MRGAALSAIVLAAQLGAGCQPGPQATAPSPAPNDTATATPRGAAPVTFHEHVAPILFSRCATCHRPVDASTPPASPGSPPSDPLCVAGAPFSVLEYRFVASRAAAIAAAVSRRAMPPWLPETGHGDFANERRLRDDEIAVIRAWADQGAPEGRPSSAPIPPTWPPGGWQLGPPDVVVGLDDVYTLQPGTRDIFRNFALPVPPTNRRFVRGIELRTDNPHVLHHANVGVDRRRTSRRLDRTDPGPGFAAMPDDSVRNVFGWSPGKTPTLEPSESAWALDDGADLVLQLHLVASRTAERVKPELGLYLSDVPPTREPVVVKLESKAIDIQSGDANYVVEDSYTLPVDVEAVSVYPHAHYLARRMEATAQLPDGRQTSLLLITSWDVRWQDQYRYRTPVTLPRGTTVRMRFTYDNSAANTRNPTRPPRRVRWGAESTDEMASLWLEVIPRRPEDAAVLARDFEERSLRAGIAGDEQRVRAAPNDTAARNDLAIKLMQAGRLDEARTHLTEALRLSPQSAETRSNLGTVLLSKGQTGEALSALQNAVRLQPNDDRLRFNLGNGYTAAGRLADAERELRRAVALNAENADAHFNLAMLVGPRGAVDEAIEHLRRAVNIDPQNGDAHRNLAVALGLKGQLAEAEREDLIAQRLLPNAKDVATHLAAVRRTRATANARRERP